MLRIEDSELGKYTAKHRGDIGIGNKRTVWIDFVASVFYVVTVLTLTNTWVKDIAGIVAAVFALGCLYRLGCVLFRNPYNAERLLKDIEAMDRTERRSSIIVIRDAMNKYRYLVYHDNGWQCDLFPNHTTAKPQGLDEDQVKRYLCNEFQLTLGDFTIRRIGAMSSQKKCAEHGNKLRNYDYQFYEADVNRIPSGWKGDLFDVGSKKCRWMTLDDMMQNANIQDKNEDVISYVKTNIV